MTENAAQKHRVYHTVGGRIVAILGNDDDTEKHEREAVVDGDQAADESKSVAVANKKGQSVSSLGTGEEVSPPVQST